MTLLFFYTDPGSGMMLLQLFLATMAGAGFYFRNFFYRIFGSKKTNSTEINDETDEQQLK